MPRIPSSLSMTECNAAPLEFQPLGRREIVAEFTGETITSDRQVRRGVLSGAAYVLMVALRHNGLRDTPLENAQCETIRLRLLKIGARVKVSVRRVWLSLSSAYPWQALLRQV